jgi:hypothetical protein
MAPLPRSLPPLCPINGLWDIGGWAASALSEDRRIAGNPRLALDTRARVLGGICPGATRRQAGQLPRAGSHLCQRPLENASPFAIAALESFRCFLVQIVSLAHMHGELSQGGLLQLYEICLLTPARMRLFVPEVARLPAVRRRVCPFCNHDRR